MYLGNTYTFEEEDVYDSRNFPGWLAGYFQVDPSTGKMQLQDSRGLFDIVPGATHVYIDLLSGDDEVYCQEVPNSEDALPSPTLLIAI